MPPSLRLVAVPSVYSTGQVAEMLGVRINTVIGWINTGKLLAFRLPMGYRERRVRAVDLRCFLARNRHLIETVDGGSGLQWKRARPGRRSPGDPTPEEIRERARSVRRERLS